MKQHMDAKGSGFWQHCLFLSQALNIGLIVWARNGKGQMGVVKQETPCCYLLNPLHQLFKY